MVSRFFTKGLTKAFLSNSQWQKGVKIFCFHGLVQSINKSKLSRNFHNINDFTSIIEFLNNKRSLKISDINSKNGVSLGNVITFDDGYANNLIAAEILSKNKIPWTLFITTGCIGNTRIIWTIELSLLILHGNANHLDLMGNKWNLHTTEQRDQAFQAIRYPMKELPMDQVLKTMDELRSQFPKEETIRLLEEFPEFQMLTWDEVRQLSNAGVAIGSHGVVHAIHHNQQPSELRINELEESKSIIEKIIQKPCTDFTFPNGNYVQSSTDEVTQAGYTHAFSLDQKTVKKDHNSIIYPRITAPGTLASFVENYYWVIE